MDTKRCSRCKESKPLSDFNIRSDTGKLHGMCKRCKKHPQLMRFYGISIEEYEAKMEAQDNLCMICKQPCSAIWKATDKRKFLSQDHDHSTGQNRDLLCDRCNRGLGNFLDDPELLEAAAAYLRKWGK